MLYKKYLQNDKTLEGGDMHRYEQILEKMDTSEFTTIIKEEVKERERKKII
jgi:hypothetical protein